MSVAHHLDSLAAYGAQAVRVTPLEGEPEDLLLEGGGLGDAYERLGQGPIVGVLRDARISAVTLGDGELVIEAVRTKDGARFRVAWGDRTVIDEVIEVPEASAVDTGPFFRPDPATRVADVKAAFHRPDLQLFAVGDVGGQVAFYTGGLHGRGAGEAALVGSVPAFDPASFGSAAFRAAHGVRWSYVIGDMAGGISSPALVVAAARAGLLGFYGAGGVPLEEVGKALARIAAECPAGAAFGANLLHNPAEPDMEERTVDLFLKHGVRRVSASAFMDLTPAVVRFRAIGLRELPDGTIEAKNHVIAKVSRPEVAERFLRPPSEQLLKELVGRGVITADQARLARRLPVASDVTVEADSGGHTDHRPLVVLIPLMLRLRDRIAAEEGFDLRGVAPRIGAAGGLGTPGSVWAAFAMGADYVLTGSVNQAAPEAGTSAVVKGMLAEASFTDVTSGPAPDMFEMGAHVQVLGRGTMYAQRAERLRELWQQYPSIEALPAADRQKIEKQIIRRNLDDVWTDTRAYWQGRDAREVERAEKDPRHKMALVFRWYLGMTSRWARVGDEDRKRDFQIWCGPAMGAFNDWASGTSLGPVEGRQAARIAEALMYGAAAHARIALARVQGLPLPPGIDGVSVVGPSRSPTQP